MPALPFPLELFWKLPPDTGHEIFMSTKITLECSWQCSAALKTPLAACGAHSAPCFLTAAISSLGPLCGLHSGNPMHHGAGYSCASCLNNFSFLRDADIKLSPQLCLVCRCYGSIRYIMRPCQQKHSQYTHRHTHTHNKHTQKHSHTAAA